MPWTAHYRFDGAYTAFSGRTTGDELLAAVRDFFAHRYARDPCFALFDFTGASEFDVDSIAIDRIVMEDRRAAATMPDLSIAVVAPEAIQYGIARMWQLRLDPTPWRTTVVTSLTQALRWLSDQGFDTDRLAVPQA